MGYTQEADAYIADRAAPNDRNRWRKLANHGSPVAQAAHLRLRVSSAGYRFLQDNGAGKWHDEEADMRRLSKRFPGVLFVSDSLGKIDGERWRIFALDGWTQKVEPVLAWPEPGRNGRPLATHLALGRSVLRLSAEKPARPPGWPACDPAFVAARGADFPPGPPPHERKPDESGITACASDGCDNGLWAGTRDGVAGLFCVDCDEGWTPAPRTKCHCGTALKKGPCGVMNCPKCDAVPW